MTEPEIIKRLKEVFAWMERRDLRVGELWLHSNQVNELVEAKDPGWDRVAQRAVLMGYLESKGALNVGFLWGACVFEAEIVPENHVGVIPDGWEAKLIDPAGCFPF
jgi:hypothetical protein